MSLIERLRAQAEHFRKVSPALDNDGWLMLGDEAAAELEAMQAALTRAEAFIRDLATCDTMIMASTLIAEADELKAALDRQGK